jgi:hypothetical protein
VSPIFKWGGKVSCSICYIYQLFKER